MKSTTLPLLGCVLAATLASHADPVTDWVSIFDAQNNDPRFVGTTATTDSPVTTDAHQDSIAANFTPVTLLDGDSITLSGSVSIDVTMTTNEFRVGLFNGPAVAQDVGNPYLGFYSMAPVRANTNLMWGPGTNATHAFGTGTTAAATPFLSVGGGSIPANTPISFSLTITRDGDHLDVASSYIAGTYNASGTLQDVDILAIKADYDFTFNTAGFLLAGSLNGDQASFSGIDVTTGSADSDNDGMLDSWELANGLDVGTDDSAGNPDNDGLTNIQEYQGADGNPATEDGTNPQVADTDGDGIDDGPEITLGTDPLDTDSDDDFFTDGFEQDNGTDPTLATSFPLPAGGLFVDFSSMATGSQDGPRHDGNYAPFVANHEIDASNALPDQLIVDRTESFEVPAFTGSPTVTLSVAYPDLLSGDPRAKQLIGRTDALAGGGYATTYEGDHRDLMRDWIGIDPRAASGGNGMDTVTSMTFTLGGIPAGTYQYRGYHHDVANVQAPFDILLTDANDTDAALGTFRMTHGNNNGLSPLTNPGTGNPPSNLPSTIEFLFTSNGTDDIVITYVTEERAAFQDSLLAVNGIEITTAVDTDGDGIPDAADLRPNDDDTGLSSDADSLTDLQEFHLGTAPDNADSDGDGFNDDVETNDGVWGSLTETGTSPFIADWDDDGLDDGLETNDLDFTNWPTAAGTDPFAADTDLDGTNDGDEAKAGYDPTDDTSFPPPPPIEARLRTVDVTSATPTATIEWDSLPGATYDIYASDTLTGDPLTGWTEVEIFYDSAGTTTTLTEELPSPTPAKRFYRIYEYPPL